MSGFSRTPQPDLQNNNAGCAAPLAILMLNVNCDYPVAGGPPDPACPGGTVVVPSSGTHCFRVRPMIPLQGPHCYGLRVTGGSQPVLVGDDLP